MCGCGGTEVVAGITIKDIAVFTLLFSAPAGVFISNLVGAVVLRGARQKFTFVILTLMIIFAGFLGLQTFARPYWLGYNSFGERITISIPFVTTAIWIYAIINHPIQKRWIDRIALVGIIISALAAAFLFIVLGIG